MAKILKCAGNDDAVTVKAGDNADTITFMFESPSEYFDAKYETSKILNCSRFTNLKFVSMKFY